MKKRTVFCFAEFGAVTIPYSGAFGSGRLVDNLVNLDFGFGLGMLTKSLSHAPFIGSITVLTVNRRLIGYLD